MRFHTSLPVKNIEETVRFYSALFQSEPVKVRDDYAKFLPKRPDINITFHVPSDPSALLLDLHLGFELADAASLEAAHERMKNAGWISTERSTSVCCYASQDKFWITDPNGYRWELYRVVSDADYKIDATSSCCGGSCDSDSQPTKPTASGCC